LPSNLTMSAWMNVEETNVKILKFMAKHKGYAADTMIAILKKRGFNVFAGFGEFFVAESEGPLKTGEIEKATIWALNLLNT